LKTDRSGDRQYAALPWRGPSLAREVLLISSRDTGRWVIPKGWPVEGHDAAQSAAAEAFEEAGVEGVVGPALGAYVYGKVQKDGVERDLTVEVFPMQVTREADEWPESHERSRRWFAATEAAARVNEGDLARIILAFAKS